MPKHAASKPIDPLPDTNISAARMADFGVIFSGHKKTFVDPKCVIFYESRDSAMSGPAKARPGRQVLTDPIIFPFCSEVTPSLVFL